MHPIHCIAMCIAVRRSSLSADPRYSCYGNVLTDTRFHTPRAPTAPAMAPAAGAGPGGLGGELAGPDPPGPGDAGVQDTPEVAPWHDPRPGCMGWVGV